MTHAVALTGQWEGLRAIPRTLRTPDHRKRLEDGLERLGGLFEQMAYRAALLTAGMDRLNGLRASMIDQLDALDAPAEDLEPSLGATWDGRWVTDDRELDASDLEPSLCGVNCGGLATFAGFGVLDGEASADDAGEPSLTTLATTPGDQSGGRWIGGVSPFDLEDESENNEPDLSWNGDAANADQRSLATGLEGDGGCDDEPSLSNLQRNGEDQTGYRWLGSLTTGDREVEQDDEGDADSEAADHD